jgi:purine-binding chemotaxis protein CheW
MKQFLEEDIYSDDDDSEPSTGAQYLSFIMADEEYAIDIKKVMEIRSYEPPTELPSAPHYLKGVINLRGIIIPIIDLRERFHIQHGEIVPTNVVIILQFPTPTGDRVMGMIVDAVSEVYDFLHDHIKQAPALVSPETLELIQGLAMAESKMIIILNVEKLFSFEEFSALDLGGLLNKS